MFNGITVSILDPDSSFSSLGTINRVISASGTHGFDRVGYGSVVIPANAANANLIAKGLVIYAYTTSAAHGAPMEIVTFFIRRIEPSITGGRAVLTVSGEDLLVELKTRNIAENIIADITTTTATAPILAFVATTTLASDASGGASTISVTSATNFDEAQPISIVLDAGGRHSTIITNVSGTTITLEDNLPGDAAEDNEVTTETGWHVSVASATGFAVGQVIFITRDDGEIHAATIAAISGTDITLSEGFAIDPDSGDNPLLALVVSGGSDVITHAVALDDIEQIMAFAPSTWNTPTNNTPDGSYIVGAGESVLEALELAKEQGGGHYRLKVSPVPVRTLVWLDAPSAPGAGDVTDLVMPPSADHADVTDDTKGVILDIRPRESEQFEQVTRIFARGAGGLKFTAAEPYISVPGGFTVDWNQSLIIQSVNEGSGATRNERYITFGGISPAGDSDAEELQAAINLYNAAFAWLNNRQSVPTYYDVTCIVHQQIPPFSTIQLTYTGNELAIDETVTVHEVTYNMGTDGRFITQLRLSDGDEFQEMDDGLYTATVVKSISRELRHISSSRGSGSGAAVTIFPPTGYQLALSTAVDDIFQVSAPGGSSQTLSFDTAVKGALLAGNGTNFVKLTVGTNNQVLTADSAVATGLKWSTPTTGSALTAGDGIDITTDVVSVDLAATSGLSFASAKLQIDDSIAGDGLLISGKVLEVNAGAGLFMFADAVNLRTPGTITATSVNDATGNHTHAIDGTIAPVVTLTAGAGLTGGGTTAANRTFNVGAGNGITVNADDVALTTPGSITSTSVNSSSGNHTHLANSTIARSAITLTAGAGLTGGGDLTANRTFDIGAGNGITVNADDVALTTPGSITSTSVNSSSGNHTHLANSTIARSAITITGTGALGGGGDLTSNRTISLNTPGTITSTSSNSSGTNHTHAINSTIAQTSDLHDPVTLGTDANAVLGLTGQQITLDTQTANTIFSGPSAGAATDPTFRALVEADLPTGAALTVSSSSSGVSHSITSSSAVSSGTAVLLATDGNGRLQIRGLGVGAAAGTNNAVTLPSAGWVGIGASAGRVTFTDAATDGVAVKNADFFAEQDTVLGHSSLVTITGISDKQVQIRGSNPLVSVIESGSDDRPVYQIEASGGHDSITTVYDAYWNGSAWISSDTGSSYRISKIGDVLSLDYAQATAGNTIANWSRVLRIDERMVQLDQGSTYDWIMQFRANPVTHGVTDLIDTTAYGGIQRFVDTQGGLQIDGITEGNVGMQLAGTITTADTTKSTSSTGAVMIRANLKSGTNVTSIGTDGNIVTARDGSNTRWIVDREGDIHRDGTTATFDLFDDVQMVRAFDMARAPDKIIRSEFDDFLKYGRADLIAAGILHESGFYNESQLQRLHNGAIWQLHQRIATLERRLTDGTHPNN